MIGEKLQGAKEFIDLQLFLGFARPSSSHWASNLRMVRKPNGTWRGTGDYRSANAQTVPDRYPMPRIEDILHELHGAQIFSVIDLERAYHQIPVAPEDVHKIAVTTPFGLFEFVGMPPGLRNASQTFQRYMDNLLRPFPFARAYLDDIVIASNGKEEHLEHLRIILDLLIKNKHIINWHKCQFAQRSIKLLGFDVSPDGFRPPVARIQAIAEWPLPETVQDLRRFLGAINYFRACIPHAAQLQAPLTDFLKSAKKRDRSKIPWTDATKEAFNKTRESLANLTRNSFLSPQAPLRLTTDASSTALGATLEQHVDSLW